MWQEIWHAVQLSNAVLQFGTIDELLAKGWQWVTFLVPVKQVRIQAHFSQLFMLPLGSSSNEGDIFQQVAQLRTSTSYATSGRMDKCNFVFFYGYNMEKNQVRCHVVEKKRRSILKTHSLRHSVTTTCRGHHVLRHRSKSRQRYHWCTFREPLGTFAWNITTYYSNHWSRRLVSYNIQLFVLFISSFSHLFLI